MGVLCMIDGVCRLPAGVVRVYGVDSISHSEADIVLL